MIRALTAVAAASIAGLATGASAQTLTRSVGYADLDLSQEAGIKTLQHRIAAAVTSVCGIVDAHELWNADQVTACRKTALDSARMQIAALVDHNKQMVDRQAAAALASR